MGPEPVEEVVEERVTIAALPGAVWSSITEPARRRSWWAYLELDPVHGGRFTERWTGPDGAPVETAGSVLAVEPERLLRLSWADEGWPAETDVEIELRGAGPSTEVRVRHTGWERLPDGRRLAEDHRAGWRLHLDHLRAHVEA